MDQSITYHFYYWHGNIPVYEYFINGVQYLFINHDNKDTSLSNQKIIKREEEPTGVMFQSSLKENGK